MWPFVRQFTAHFVTKLCSPGVVYLRRFDLKMPCKLHSMCRILKFFHCLIASPDGTDGRMDGRTEYNTESKRVAQ